MSFNLQKIIYAEDEPDVQMVVVQTLKHIGGFEVCPCNNGSELLENINKFDPDLILLDVMMPDMDGATTLKHLKQNIQTRNIPIIFLTAKAQLKDVDAYKQLGVIGVITKPFDPLQLSDIILEMWSEYNKQ